MRKKSHHYFYLALCLLAVSIFVGCDSSDDPPLPPPPVGTDLAVEADIAPIQTRASWDKTTGKAAWAGTDAIGVFVGANSNKKLTLDQSGKFTGKLDSEPSTTADYYGYYPYTDVANIDGKVVTVTVPATQHYDPNGFAAAPMVAAYNGSISEAQMTFQHVFSTLKVSATLKSGLASTTVSSVRLSGNRSETLAGVAAIDLSGVSNTMSASTPIAVSFASGAPQSLTLTCGSGVAVTDASPTDFYVTIPAGDYVDGVELTFTTPDGDITVAHLDAVAAQRACIHSIQVELGVTVPIETEDIEFVANSPVLNGYTFIPGGALDNGKGRMQWVANEMLGLFSVENENVQFTQVGGSMNIDKTKASYEGEVKTIANDETTYVYAPYSADITLVQNKMTMELPDVQKYYAEGNGALPVVAAYKGSPDGKTLDFHNILGTISLKVDLVEGSMPLNVKAVRLETAIGEKLSGMALVDVSGVAAITDHTQAIPVNMLAGTHILTLECGDGVLLEVGEPVDFRFAVPPTTMLMGFYIFWVLDDDSEVGYFHSPTTIISRGELMELLIDIDNREGAQQGVTGRPGSVGFDKDTNIYDA